MSVVTDLLMLVMQPCYDLTQNWWLAILLFTIITKIILLPMSLWCQWNSIIMVKLMPDLNRIKIKHFGDGETIGEKQNALYKERHYHPLLSLVPLAVQVLILFGLVDVIHYITDNGAPGTEFLGMVPTTDGGLSWIMPLLAGLSAVVMGFAQNRINPLQREQSRAEKNMTNGLSIGLSLFLGVFVAAGMCFYWIISNLSAILIQVFCNIVIKPAKFIDYEDLKASQEEFEALNALDAESKTKWYKPNPLAKREKQDYRRFFNVVNKHIVFFSESSGYYRYFEGPLMYLLEHSEGDVHYVTNDPNDQIFEIAKIQPRIRPYYIGPKKIITLMMKMDADVVVLTMEDLENYYIKRSYIRQDVEYVFFFHHMTSTHMVALKESYDHFDTIMCAGPHQVQEIRRAEELRNLPAKNLVEYGYALLDHEIEQYEVMQIKNERPVVLIAPSWQEDCILDLCIDDMLNSMLGRGWRIIVRPHPEYVKRYKPRWQALTSRFAHVSSEELFFQEDSSSAESVFTSDILVTDWSSIGCEFSFATKKPSVFVDTPMKVGNPDWEELGIPPTDITLRNQIGISVAVEKTNEFGDIIADMLAYQHEWNDRISQVRDGFIFNLEHSSEVGGEYLLNRILAKQEEARSKEGQND